MKIKDLNDKEKVVELTAEVASVIGTEQTDRGSQVQRVLLQDDSGQVVLKLWGEQIGSVKEGDQVIIKNGYSKLFKDEMELSTGKFGSLKINSLK